MADRRPITVVVPVYGDLPSLLRCVDALIETVDTHRDTVLLVNDCGPDADAIEEALLERIAGLSGFLYERNDRNLGFVGACNRAVLELDTSGNDVLLLNSDTVALDDWLDELGAVLHDDPSHGIVCARSTNATIASLPFRLRDPAAPRTLERSLAVRDALKDRLPRYSYPPVAMGFCFLVRRELVDRHGLFDEVFAPGYGEENDFCLRMGREGFRSVMAHRALVVHEGARSFLSARRARLRREHEAILVQRHPDYPAKVRQYLWRDIDPIDAFADVLVNEASTPTVMIVADRHADIPEALVSGVPAAFQVSILTKQRASRAAQRRFPSAEVVTLGAEEGRVWDAAILADAASTTMRLRASHASPRVLPASSSDLLQELRRPIDDTILRAQWAETNDELGRVGIPLPASPRLRARVRRALEQRLPRALALRQRWMSRRR